jgi:hypothetical protein
MQLLVNIRGQQFVTRISESRIQRQHREGVIHRALVDQYLTGKRAFPQVVGSDHFLQPCLGTSLAVAPVSKINPY